MANRKQTKKAKRPEESSDLQVFDFSLEEKKLSSDEDARDGEQQAALIRVSLLMDLMNMTVLWFATMKPLW